jgi:hypothetical protein
MSLGLGKVVVGAKSPLLVTADVDRLARAPWSRVCAGERPLIRSVTDIAGNFVHFDDQIGKRRHELLYRDSDRPAPDRGTILVNLQ